MAARSRCASLALLALFSGAAVADTGPGMLAGTNQRWVEARSRREIDLFRDNFRLIDSRGRAWSLGGESGRKRIALVALNPSCAGARDVLRWARSSAPEREDVELVFLDPSRPQDRGAVESLQPGAPVLMDHAQAISRGFGFRRSGDFLVLEPGSWRVVASGAAYDGSLARALGGSAPGILDRVRALFRREPECELGYENEGTALTKNVADALYRTCVACHLRNAGSDIFHSYADWKQWHEMNRMVLRLYRMPAGGKDYDTAECGPTAQYHDVTPADLSLVTNWIERGEPREGTDDPIAEKVREDIARPAPPRAKPDLFWSSPATDRIPADGFLRYVYRQLGPFPRDLYVRGASIRFNGLVTHHVAAFTSPDPLAHDTVISLPPAPGMPGPHRPIGIGANVMAHWTKIFEWNNQPAARWAREGTVVKLPKGSYLILEQHLESVGRPETNHTTLALYFDPHPEGKLQARKIELYFRNFVIPPMKKDFELVKTYEMDADTSILSAMVHGHYRLARFYFKLIYPGGRERLLCNVPYRQVTFPFFPEFYAPVFAPKGSRIEFHLIYDNSQANPLNPNPAAPVWEGPFFSDFEMGIAQLTTVPGRMPGAR